MRLVKKIFRAIIGIVLFLVLLIGGFFLYVLTIDEPQVPNVSQSKYDEEKLVAVDSNLTMLGKCWIRKNEFGLYDMYLEGNAYDRGVAYGKLAKELIYKQELAFTSEIQRMIPSSTYLKFLKYVVRFMNRDLAKHVTEEYLQEIYGVSKSASDNFGWIGGNFARQLNYHAAHDIGHALANMMLVGCTSFATWGSRSKDGELLVGRNFDFYVGDEFAKNKIVAFYKPDNGIPFMSIIWGGFTGVVSGMNTKGLTVTINANKSAIPGSAATPVSLVAREILQYASNINEAIAIAKKRIMFVSESFLISSAIDNKAVVIEKTPEKLDVYESKQDYIQCTNHYQSNGLMHQELNEEQKKKSASIYRYLRLQELIETNIINTPQRTASILRDYKGKGNTDIGLTNEKSINQFIAHHSIIFSPKKGLVWVSTNPWQLGEYVCYDINSVFNYKPNSVIRYSENIPKDSFLHTNEYSNLKTYLVGEQQFAREKRIADEKKFMASNPNYYDTYRILGDIAASQNRDSMAFNYYQKALTLEIATLQERESIEKKLSNIRSLRTK